MNFEKLDEFLNDMPQRGFPGCELGITVDGKEVYHRCVGYSDAEGTRPARRSDLYWIFSATKVVTCLAALRLIEEGKLALNDPVSKYIPEYGAMKICEKDGTVRDAETVMTVEHLFTMTGGMTYNVNYEEIARANEINADTQTVVKMIAKAPLIFEPGTHYKYSLCHDVLGAVIEVASGKRLSEYMEELFFAPLGMTDTGFRPTDAQRSRITQQYRADLGACKADPIPPKYENYYRNLFTPDFDSGGGGLYSSVDDYLKLITAIACGGKTKDGVHLLSPETIAMAQVNRLCPDAMNDFVSTRLYGYGWGLCGRVHIDPTYSLSLSPVGEFGWDGAAGAFAMIDTTNRVALYFATHVHGSKYVYNVIHPLLRNLTYEAIR